MRKLPDMYSPRNRRRIVVVLLVAAGLLLPFLFRTFVR